MVRRRGRLWPRAKAPGRPPCFPAAMYSRRMPRIATCRPADAVRLLADGFGRGRLKRASLEARKRCRAWPAQIPEAALFRVTLSGGPARVCNCRHGVWCRLLTARFLPASRLAVIDRPANRPGGAAWGAAACACACGIRPARHAKVGAVARHDPLACRRRIRRRERCRLRPARCMVPPLGGTVSAWQLPGGKGGSCRRAGVRRAWRRQSAALYSRPIGRLKIGGGAPPEWCRQTRYRQSTARSTVPPNGAAQNRLAKARLKTGGGPAARRPDRAGGNGAARLGGTKYGAARLGGTENGACNCRHGMVPAKGGTENGACNCRHGMVPAKAGTASCRALPSGESFVPHFLAASVASVSLRQGFGKGGAVPRREARSRAFFWRHAPPESCRRLAGTALVGGNGAADWRTVLAGRQIGIGDSPAWMRSLGMRMSWSMRSPGMRMSWSMRECGVRECGAWENAESGNADVLEHAESGNAEFGEMRMSGDCPPARIGPAGTVPPDMVPGGTIAAG